MVEIPLEHDDLRNPLCVALGQNLKALRIAAAKSQEDLAVDAEIDRTYISSIERGVANPTVLALAQICYALNISLADLLATVHISSKPTDSTRRANAAQPIPRTKKSRLR
jgi:transcriptional regulator with XRE-family HTH domain